MFSNRGVTIFVERIDFARFYISQKVVKSPRSYHKLKELINRLKIEELIYCLITAPA